MSHAGIPNTIVRVDNILITGPNDEKHLQNLREVLSVCKEFGLKLRKEKCKKGFLLYINNLNSLKRLTLPSI